MNASLQAALPASSMATAAHPAAPSPAPEHAARRATLIGLLLSLLAVAAFGVWAALAPLDEGVPAHGSVVVDSKRKAVQHATGGIVRSVLVGEGSVVVQGQPLLRLDDAAARATYETVRQRYLGMRAMEARLRAERDGLAEMAPHPDLRAALGDPLIGAQWLTQQHLMQSRRAALAAELAGLEESRAAQAAALAAGRAQVDSRQTQLALLREELTHTRSLVQEGYAPRNRQLELERQVAETQAALSELQGHITRSLRATAELDQRTLQRKGEYRKEVGAQLADVQRDVDGDADKLKAAREELDRMEIRAPSSGQVVGLVVQSVGAVIQPAQKLADIVPADEALMLEARVPPHLVDRVRQGLPVDVRFSGFAHSPQLVVQADVKSVSADALTDPVTQQTYYLARVDLTAAGRSTLGTRRLQPGMPVEVIFRTGERSLLTYLLGPLTKSVAAAMKEE
jgi:protease secretion system membrane fusion protein